MSEQPQITFHSLLSLQVCVPSEWDDEQVGHFAEKQMPCGTSLGWQIRRGGDPLLGDYPERNPCAERAGFVHIMLDA